ncbi:MAG: UDP-N-acetylmuramoyl-tripeptide--D-alanyl-D-alanine ligase [Sulfobacillus thermosulfidooxidans]|uniref:UDP-N-acetylmuramoyl-tripeptide--D-alanyl-D-alanine ligase n=1 Tax=Sulfobacillus thermosulfidooxidans TaxID=28034 RepID=A0A2T2X685_SULTH|nr:MAG: UDP-N-acetylmuramoyl-tripeptide--D-alanyl-D-alanine ligase [Sulfobacillus thermosulfidooxidans]
MMVVKVKDIVDFCSARPWGVELDDVLKDVTIHSQEVRPGSLFVALPGTRTHGHQFVPDVWAQGGIAMVEKTYAPITGSSLVVDSPLMAMGTLTRSLVDTRHITVVGITGSVGKTSAKELIAATLQSKFVVGKSQGNYNTAIGIPLSFLRSPDSMTHFVAEMGMRALGEIAQLTTITPPDVAVITNIGPNHLESLGSIKNIQRAKGEILQGLKPQGTAVLNADDPLVRELGEHLSDHPILWFGHKSGDVIIDRVHMLDTATEVTLLYQGDAVTIRIPWLGEQHGANVAAAFLVGTALGLCPDEIRRGLEQVDPGTGRLQRRSVGSLTILADYYNASPLSTTMGLQILAAHKAMGRRIAVLGDMLELGSQEEPGHWQVGTAASRNADMVLAVGSRARIIAKAANLEKPGVATWVANLNEAFTWLQTHVRAGDVILLKASHGMNFDELYQRLKDWGGPS